MSSPFAHTCLCGHRISPGQRCPVCEPKPTEAERLRRNPNRASYVDPRYHANRLTRYRLCGGLCECGCGTRLKGALWSEEDGARPWECHHVPTDSPEYDHMTDRDDVANLRCLYRAHHNRFTR